MLDFISSNHYFLFELFVLVRLSAQSMLTITLHVMTQDKYCYIVHSQTKSFCENIHSDSIQSVVKDQILSESVQFLNSK